MDQWDKHAAERLGTAVEAMAASGFVDIVREEARQLWRANCERYEPEQLFDDAATLGFSASRNVLNAVRDAVKSEGVATSRLDEFGVPVFGVDEFDVRVFKTPGATGRRPRMTKDFDWSRRESRNAAACRNAYRAPAISEGMAPLFEMPRAEAAAGPQLCREIFVFWGGDLESRLTAGWAGLPTSQKGSWLAVRELWWDEKLPKSAMPKNDVSPDGTSGLEGKPIPTPILRLRRDAGQVEA